MGASYSPLEEEKLVHTNIFSKQQKTSENDMFLGIQTLL